MLTMAQILMGRMIFIDARDNGKQQSIRGANRPNHRSDSENDVRAESLLSDEPGDNQAVSASVLNAGAMVFTPQQGAAV